MKKNLVVLAICCLSLCLLPRVAAQTFEIEGQPANAPQKKAAPAPGAKKPGAKQAPQGGEALGWGSSIEVGRMARAAEDSLKRGNAAQAANFAERAAKAAPQNAKLWFLLGYTSRLAGRYAQSVQAYQRGLQAEPGSADGMSGLAQTYAKMGRTDEAKRMLVQLINANPKRQNDLLVAGELFMQTGDTQQGINYLQRAEAIKPSAHAELMLAIAYLKLKQPARAKQMLDVARRRDPKNPAIFRAVATYYREQHDYKSAITTLKSAPRPTPELLADLGYTYGLNGDKKESADAYVRAANAAPKEIKMQLSAAQGEMTLGALDKARQFIARAESLDANHYRLHAIKAAMAKMENRPADAIREYNEAIARLPEAVPEGQLYPVQLRLNLADLYREQGMDAQSRQQIALAEQAINKLQVEGPARAEFLRVRASIRSSGQDFAGAETDLKEAMRLDPANTNITLQYANLLWKMKRPDESRRVYNALLEKEPNNRFALEAMGYLAREAGDNKSAEQFFQRFAKAYPNDYVPHLALGDLYTAAHNFSGADAQYEQAYKLAPTNPVIIANAANAAIENRQIPLAGRWVARAEGKMLDDPRVMRERERYMFHTGKFVEAAALGRKVLEKLPKDRNASVYLAYALYNLGRYDDVLALGKQYEYILPREPNFPLLVGHVHKQVQLLDQAVDDYSRAIERDPKMVEAYVNRGYTRNDLQDAEEAQQDFEAALKIAPNNGTAHLGLAFANLQLRHGKQSLDEVDTAEKIMGESGATHLARATALRQMRLLERAEKEYEAALKYAPDDLRLNMALADTQYHLRKYPTALQTLSNALRLSPDDPLIYAQMAHANAYMHNRAETMQYVAAAERAGADQSEIFLNTGDALLTLGDRDAAMERFARALAAPDANRVDARLAIAKLFVHEGRRDDARQQVALAFAESRVGEASPVTADNLVEAANLFLALNDFDLARTYFRRAKDAGAADQVVAIGMANSYLAQGQSQNAQAELASLGNPDDYRENYDYMLAMGTFYRQQHQTLRALGTFARANLLSGDDPVAERQLEEVAGEEGLRLTNRWSVGTQFEMNGIFEDATIYNLDRQIFGAPDTALPPPRSSLETRWMNTFRMHQGGWPTVSGFFQIRNARGQISIPSDALILDRNTFDYSLNGAINPVVHMGPVSLAFNTGVQFTWRRDKEAPTELNQNLFRQFLYVSSNSVANWIAMRASAFHEAGPFTNRPLNSREVGAHLEFVVGRPWGRTQLITGYTVRDLQFSPAIREFFSTTTSIGLQRQFGEHLKVAALGEYIRSWRAQNDQFFLAQAIRPAGEFQYKVNDRWSAEGDFAWSRGESFRAYDNIQNSFFINYDRPFRRNMIDGDGEVPVTYPLRFSVGIQSANYFNFTGRGQAIVRPVIRLSLF